MDFTEILQLLKKASPYELFRLKTALVIEMQNPEKIQILRHSFAVNDRITYFNARKNAQCQAIVLEKKLKHVVIKDLEDNAIWNTPYYAINLTGQDSHIHVHKAEKLTRNHLRLNELVGFMHLGEQWVGHIKKFNPKSVSLVTQNNKRWRVGYGLLFKILEGEHGQGGNGKCLIEACVME